MASGMKTEQAGDVRGILPVPKTSVKSLITAGISGLTI